MVRRHADHNQTSRLSCRVRPAVLCLKGTFEILANTRGCDPATIPDARHRYDSIFEAMSPIQCEAPYDPKCLLHEVSPTGLVEMLVTTSVCLPAVAFHRHPL